MKQTRKLTRAELVGAIKSLQGGQVCTVDEGIANDILDVDESRVVRRSAKSSKTSSVAMKHFWNTYEYVWAHGHVTHDHFKKPDFHGDPVGDRVACIILAILRDAVPEQIEAFKRGPDTPVRHTLEETQRLTRRFVNFTIALVLFTTEVRPWRPSRFPANIR